MQNIITYFLQSAEKYPDHKAVIAGNQQVTYGELYRDVRRLAYKLKARGLKKGDKVLVLVPMSIDLYKVLLSLFYLGLTAVFPDEWVGITRLNQCCRKVSCQAVIHTTKTGILRFLSKEIRKIPMKLKPDTSGHRELEGPVETEASATALITLTTGSTNLPKAANRTHQFLHEQYSALTEVIQTGPHETDLVSLPIVLLLNLGTGATSVIPAVSTEKLDPGNCHKIVNQINNHQATRITASPHVLKQISLHVQHTGITPDRVRHVITGGGPVFPADAALLYSSFKHSGNRVIYGSTEAEPISTISLSEVQADKGMSEGKGLMVGKPYHKTQVAIIPITYAPLNSIDRLNPEEIGEIVVSGPHVLQSYYNSDEAFVQNKIVHDNTCWHRTGDAGYIDSSGNLYLTGRINTMIKTENGWISPFIAEYNLSLRKGIKNGTVVYKNKAIVLVVELYHWSYKKDISRILEDFPISYDQLKIVKSIPMDKRHHSKIDYQQLVLSL